VSDSQWDLLFRLAGVAIVAIGALLSYRSWRTQSAKKVPPAAGQVAVHAMTGRQAQEEARAILDSSTPFQVTRGPLSAKERSLRGELPGDVYSFFSRYQEVAGGGAHLARSEIAPFARDPSFIRLGSDLENADVVVRKSDGRVFVFEKGGTIPGDEDAYQSIWHYVLEVASHTTS
jgi:hypothetical protein